MQYPYESYDVNRMNKFLFFIGLLKIRMIGFVRPRMVEMSATRAVLRVKLRRRTKNHFNSMYLGALMVGSELIAGLPIFYMARQLKMNLSLVFKNTTADFIKRPDYDVFFVCEPMEEIEELLEALQNTKERITKDIKVYAYTNYNTPNEELVAQFTYGLSVKNKG